MLPFIKEIAACNIICTHFVFSSMNLFEKNWITSRFVDFELKKYTFLAYLQKIEQKFTQSKVYPYLSILREENEALIKFSQQIDMLAHQYKALPGISKAQQVPFNSEIETLIRLTEFAVPRLKSTIESGNEIEHFVLNALEFRPVGLLPVERSEGYLIFRQNAFSRIYRYQLRKITPFSDSELHSNHLKTWFVQHAAYGNFRNAEDVKYELIKTHKDLPNPATYCVESEFELPYAETLVPIGRKLLYRILLD
jgi:hypothetical protein